MEYRVDQERSDAAGGGTGIYVRAKNGDNWVNADICELDKESLLAWLRSRGGNNPWAEDVVGILLGHGNLNSSAPCSGRRLNMDDAAKAVIDKTYDELVCGARTLAPSFELEQTLALAGYVIVPREPSEQMVNAGADALSSWDDYHCECNEREVWKSMIRASAPCSGQGE